MIFKFLSPGFFHIFTWSSLINKSTEKLVALVLFLAGRAVLLMWQNSGHIHLHEFLRSSSKRIISFLVVIAYIKMAIGYISFLAYNLGLRK